MRTVATGDLPLPREYAETGRSHPYRLNRHLWERAASQRTRKPCDNHVRATFNERVRRPGAHARARASRPLISERMSAEKHARPNPSPIERTKGKRTNEGKLYNTR